ncbi:MAG: multidrug effflux MFS transporter [Acidimicrobiales bacterium]|nr:multidrug effflux MFS transporter [Acidimicrobiales bacterium]RZV47564.1 MAG: MFS transporter [Acidimicrobiales bacterium]
MSSGTRDRHGLRRGEFIAMMSMATAAIAMSIDTVLPAFDEMEAEFGLGDNSVSLTVTIFFIAMAAGVAIYGPLADRFGRKPIMYASFTIFVLGAIVSTVSTSFEMFLVGRAIWGFGAAGPRAVSIAITRDCYSGDTMARIMSFIGAIFMLVPVLAPAAGEGLLLIGDWRWTTGISVVLGIAVMVWFTRLEETLTSENVIPLELGKFARASRTVVTNRQTVLFTAAAALSYGAFFPWLGSSVRMIEDIYGREGQFAWFFGFNAIGMALAILLAARAVTHFGTYRVTLVSTTAIVIIAAIYVGIGETRGLGFWTFFLLACALTAFLASTNALYQTLAMDPMGEVAGTAASITGVVIIGVGAVLGAIIDRAIDTTVIPFGVASLLYGGVGLVAVLAARPTRNSASENELVVMDATPKGIS